MTQLLMQMLSQQLWKEMRMRFNFIKVNLIRRTEWQREHIVRRKIIMDANMAQALLETGRVFCWRPLACPDQQRGVKGSLPSPPGAELGIRSPECFWHPWAGRGTEGMIQSEP